jgi:hypothetical protein
MMGTEMAEKDHSEKKEDESKSLARLAFYVTLGAAALFCALAYIFVIRP